MDSLGMVLANVERATYRIGIKVSEEAQAKARAFKDTGAFHDNLDYQVSIKPRGVEIAFIARAKHSPFVLGGKVPSYTPIAPLVAWVERKKLAWLDKKGKPMSSKSMAFIISRKHHSKGIEARNVIQEAFDENRVFIYNEIDGALRV